MKLSRLFSVFLFITFSLLALASVSAMTVMYFFRQEDRMAYGLQVAGQPVTGLSRSEAKALLEKKLQPQAEKPALILTYQQRSWLFKPDAIGLQPDIPATVEAAYNVGRQQGIISAVLESAACAIQGRNLPVLTTLDENRLRVALAKPAREIGRPVQDAAVILGTRGIIHTPSQEGLELNVDELIDELREPLLALRLPQQHEVILTRTKPKITSADLKDIDTVLSSYSSYFTADSDRGENVRLAANRLDGSIILSGDEFSFNQAVGPRNADAGFLDAPVIIGGRVEPGVGGGVCQVSSTLYNAILLADLTPTERQPHFYPSGYVPPGLDATVADGLIDFCFKNTLPHPVVLTSYVSGNELTCQVLGCSNDLTSDVYLETTNPSHNRYISYRVYEQNGVEINREQLYVDDYDDPLPAEQQPPATDAGTVQTAAPEPAPVSPDPQKKRRPQT